MFRSRLTLAFICCLLLSSCKEKQALPPKPIPVNFVYSKSTARCILRQVQPQLRLPLYQVNFFSQVQGFITGIFFKEGSHVKKGDKLYEMTDRIYESNYNAAADNLKLRREI